MYFKGWFFYQGQLLVSCKSWLFHFLWNVYHLILWDHLLMKVQMSLAQFRYLIFFLVRGIFLYLFLNFNLFWRRAWPQLMLSYLIIWLPTDSFSLEVSSGRFFNTANIFWLLCHYKGSSFKGGLYMCFIFHYFGVSFVDGF